MEDKKGVFFSTDALIAVSILFLFMLIAIPLVKETKTDPVIHRDVLTTLSSLKIGEIDNPTVKNLISEGRITDSSKTLLEQIGEFYVKNKTLAKNLTDEILSSLSQNDNIGIWFGDPPDLISSKATVPYEDAKDVDIVTQEITGIQETNENFTGFAARAYLSKAMQSKYFYFGGYIGDGNISIRVEYNGTISSAILETTINSNFTVYINNESAGTFSKSNSDIVPKQYSLPIGNFSSGINFVDIKGNDSLYISGGFLKINFLSDVEYDSNITRYYFPGISGTINLYDSFYAPTIDSMNVYLHYNSSQESYFSIGNKTIFNTTAKGLISQTIDNSNLSSMLNYASMSNNTIPIRLGLRNISYVAGYAGNADVILITDTSGSMAEAVGGNGYTAVSNRQCWDPLIDDPTTQKLLLAKCIDKEFIGKILAVSGNKVGLVSFSNVANNEVNLTTDQSQLNTTINNYDANGGTCVSCAINRAYLMLNKSDQTRKKFIIVMTDGVTNYRSTESCMNVNAITNSSALVFQVGDSGLFINKSDIWRIRPLPSTNNSNSISLINNTFGFVVGDNGNIIKWNGSSFSNYNSPVSSNLNGVKFLNGRLAFAAGTQANGEIIFWNGTEWKVHKDLGGSISLNAIDIYQIENDTRLLEYPFIEYATHYWSFNESSGSIADDSIGSADLTVLNNKWISGINGNGYNSSTGLSSSTNFNFNGLTGLTINFWIKNNITNITGTVFGINYTRTNWNINGNFKLKDCPSSSQLMFQIRDSSSWKNSNCFNITRENIWTMVTLTINSSTAQIFLNNSLTQVISLNNFGFNIYNYTMFAGNSSTSRLIKSYIDEFSIWNKTLSSNEVMELYTKPGLLPIDNSTLGFAVGQNYIYQWNGKIWNPTSFSGITLYDVDILNSTFAFAVGSSGKIYYWSGASWTQNADLGSMIVHNIEIINSTFAFVTTSNNRIYRWNGASWTSIYSDPDSQSNALYGLDMVNSTLGYAAGNSKAGLIIWNGTAWTRTFPEYLYNGNSTNGISCSDPGATSCPSVSVSIPMLNTNYSSCRTRSDLNATLYSIGFGDIADCDFASKTLIAVSTCGNGSFYASSDASQLKGFYDSIASSILDISYNEQTTAVQGNFSSVLYPDSYIEIVYNKPRIPPGIILSLEQKFSNNFSGSFIIPNGSTLIDAYVTSYSGPKWTFQTDLNNYIVYNITKYGKTFIEIGDPYVITLPNSLILTGSNNPNIVNMLIAGNISNVVNGSEYNKIIYRIAKNISSYTNIMYHSTGCKWSIQFEDNSTQIYNIPYSYTGASKCAYNSSFSSPDYSEFDNEDALQHATYDLLSQLDLDNNGKIDINLPEQFLDIADSNIQGIPFNWKTQIQVRIWK